MAHKNGGAIVAEVLRAHGVHFLFTLCGGHISPILIESRARGIRIIDVRDEKNAVFAADAVARMTGIPGVAAVTAGPGVTNTVTAVKNAQMAQSPVVLLGGAAATVLKGRGALQDIDQLSLMRPLTKWATRVTQASALRPTLERAFAEATCGVPGPVFVELPIDLLYDEQLVREWYMKESGAQGNKSLGGRALKLYLEGRLLRQFHAPAPPAELSLPELRLPSVAELTAGFPPPSEDLDQMADQVAARLSRAERPVLVIGSQAMVHCKDATALAAAVSGLGVPTFLGGTARGLLGRQGPLQFRHARGKALQEADLVIVAGFPFDFRLGYGRGISGKAALVSINLSTTELRKNRRPDLAVKAHPGQFLEALGKVAATRAQWSGWIEVLRAREQRRDLEIAAQGALVLEKINPIAFFLALEQKLPEDAVLVVDGGDFVATGAYVLRPRAPQSWLDPGVFGTLGVGGGFATGACLVRPQGQVWLIYGDGSSAYSLAEFDTFARHGLAPIAVIGNDGAWAQIAREQVELFSDPVGTVLRRSAYHTVAEGYGGVGLLLDDPSRIEQTLEQAMALSASGKPVCINVHISQTQFRKGSISI
jgi:acetolactate synthase-like protein